MREGDNPHGSSITDTDFGVYAEVVDFCVFSVPSPYEYNLVLNLKKNSLCLNSQRLLLSCELVPFFFFDLFLCCPGDSSSGIFFLCPADFI